MLNKRTQTEIDSFFSKLFTIPEEVRKVSSSAFTQCRSKIKHSAFSFVFEALNDYFYVNYNYRKYHGFRLIAIDGSVYSLPKTKKMVKEFGENVLSDSGKWVKAQVSFAADVLNNICVGAVIGAYKESEHMQALRIINKLGNGNLYLFDRGYFGRSFLGAVIKSGCQFCFRVQSNACREFVAFINSNETDMVGHIKVEGKDIKVRFTKIILDTNETEYLITSLLDKKIYTRKMLKELYHERWGVEEQYKDMKYAICVENFIGKCPSSIKQEFYANIITYNLSMMLCKPIIDKLSNKEKKKHKYKTNKRALLAKVKQCFVRLFYLAKEVKTILEDIIKTVSKESVPIRKDRKFPRGKTVKVKIKHCRAYVSAV
jgi:hypothetical protein